MKEFEYSIDIDDILRHRRWLAWWFTRRITTLRSIQGSSRSPVLFQDTQYVIVSVGLGTGRITTNGMLYLNFQTRYSNCYVSLTLCLAKMGDDRRCSISLRCARRQMEEQRMRNRSTKLSQQPYVSCMRVQGFPNQRCTQVCFTFMLLQYQQSYGNGHCISLDWWLKINPG